MVVYVPETSSARDFDFWMGSWTVRGRRLRERLVGCEEWVEIGGTSVECDDTFDGRPIRVRYTWSRVTTGSPRWEQAFSADGGSTWETNWINDFARAE